ncbi:MAG: Xaa-Pro peptidase family protein [Synergistaceae bacterium]|jgi:Xaa-Pro aminopeptidase|nr:Xaa-Pro peptidase family protein [Synergistaceae bacterium]
MPAKNEQPLKVLSDAEIDALIITKPENQRYLEGFTGRDCYMLVSSGGNFLIADSRYTEMGEKECKTATVLPYSQPYPPLGDVLASVAKERSFGRVGFERGNITWGDYDNISKRMEDAGVVMMPTSSLIEGMRAKKTPHESAMIGAACQIADRALKDILSQIRPGVSELDIKIELDYHLKTGGAEETAFDTIVLFGARSSQPHANPRRDVYLRKGDLVLIDYGAVKGGYRSDTTRTFVCGKASGEQRSAYEAVLEAQMESIEMVMPGAEAGKVNDRAAGMIKDAGLLAFEHGIGHGVGLEIHELPSLRRGLDTVLESGNVITIEPAMYRPGWGGIRIEDTVLVTDDGHSVLTFFPKELIEL